MSVRSLGAAVINRAVSDLLDGDARERKDARGFLCNRSEVLDFWCAVAHFDPDVIVDRCRRGPRELAKRLKEIRSQKWLETLAQRGEMQ